MFLSTVEVILLIVYFFYNIVLETPSVCWIGNQSIFCAFCHDMFLSTDAVILLIVYFFDAIVTETPSVKCQRNISRVFVQIFDYMEYPWLNMFSSLLVLNRNDQKCLGLRQKKSKYY